MNQQQHRQNLHLKLITAKAGFELAKLAHGKAKGEHKANPTSDKKRFQLQDAIGRVHRAQKLVWMTESLVPK
jgi:hypothetical protein